METFFITRPTATGQVSAKGHATYTSDDFKDLQWSAKFPLPQLGDRIYITMNGIGWAIVKGFFASHGYLGVMTKPENPPEWLKTQRERAKKAPEYKFKPQWVKDGIGCEFGAEIALDKPKQLG